MTVMVGFVSRMDSLCISVAHAYSTNHLYIYCVVHLFYLRKMVVRLSFVHVHSDLQDTTPGLTYIEPKFR